MFVYIAVSIRGVNTLSLILLMYFIAVIYYNADRNPHSLGLYLQVGPLAARRRHSTK